MKQPAGDCICKVSSALGMVPLLIWSLVPFACAKLHRYATQHALCRMPHRFTTLLHMPTPATTKMGPLLPSRWPPPMPCDSLRRLRRGAGSCTPSRFGSFQRGIDRSPEVRSRHWMDCFQLGRSGNCREFLPTDWHERRRPSFADDPPVHRSRGISSSWS